MKQFSANIMIDRRSPMTIKGASTYYLVEIKSVFVEGGGIMTFI